MAYGTRCHAGGPPSLLLLPPLDSAHLLCCDVPFNGGACCLPGLTPPSNLLTKQAAGTVAEAAVGRRAASITVAAVGQGGAPTGEGSLQSGDADLAAPAKRPASPACPQAESQPKCTKCPAPAPCPTVAQARRKQAAPAIDANATMVAAAAAAAAAEAARREDLSPSLRLPWETLLSEADVQRGLSYWGTGARLRAVAAKLAAGQPIKVGREMRVGGYVGVGRAMGPSHMHM